MSIDLLCNQQTAFWKEKNILMKSYSNYRFFLVLEEYFFHRGDFFFHVKKIFNRLSHYLTLPWLLWNLDIRCKQIKSTTRKSSSKFGEGEIIKQKVNSSSKSVSTMYNSSNAELLNRWKGLSCYNTSMSPWRWETLLDLSNQ